MSEFRENTAAYWEAAKQDWADGTLPQRLGLLATGAAFVVHEAGMETLVATVGLSTLEASHGNPIEAAIAMGLTSGVVESGLTFAVSKSVSMFRAVGKAVATRRYFEDTVDSTTLEKVTNATTAITLGSPGVIIQDFARHPDKTYGENVKTGLKTTKGLALMNAGIGLVVGGGTWMAHKFGVDTTRYINDVVEFPGTFPAIFAASRLANWLDIRSRRQKYNAEHGIVETSDGITPDLSIEGEVA